jgi:hypothetical protein
LSKEFTFLVFLLERYGASKGVTGGEALRWLDQAGQTEFVRDMYEMYHAEALDNAFADIDHLLATGRPLPEASW